MASLGELTAVLGVDTKQLRQADLEMKKFGGAAQKGFDNVSKAAKGLTSRLAGLAVGFASLYTIRAVFTKMIAATIEQENALRKVETVLKSTGGVSGKTTSELAKLASSLQNVTTYGDEAILGMQALLLTFKNIKGDTFDQATETVLNLSAAMGTDLKSSAIMLGKALNDPILGMTAMRRVGIQFTDVQEAIVKKLVESGKVMEAQKLILGELDSQFGGMARALRGNIGGAITGFKNALGDLFEMNNLSNVDKLREAIEKLSVVLQSTAARKLADELGVLLTNGAIWAADAIKTLSENLDEVYAIIKALAVLKISKTVLTAIGLVSGPAGWAALAASGGVALSVYNDSKAKAEEAAKVLSINMQMLATYKSHAVELQTQIMAALKVGDEALADSLRGALSETYDYIEAYSKLVDGVVITEADKPAPKKPSGTDKKVRTETEINEAKKRSEQLAAALRNYRDGIAELTLAAGAYKQYQLDDWFEQEYQALKKIPPELQKLYDLKKAQIALDVQKESPEAKTQLLITALRQEGEALSFTTAIQKAMTLARQEDIKVGSAQYQMILKQIELNEAIQRNMDLTTQITVIKESLFTQEEAIRASYAAQVKIVIEAMDAEVLAVADGTTLITALMTKQGKDLKDITKKTFEEDMKAAFEGWANSFAGQLNDMLWKSNVTFEEIAVSFAKMITEMIVQIMIVKPLMTWLMGIFGTGGVVSGGKSLPLPGGFDPLALGGVISNGALTKYARGGVVNKPTLFPMAGGMGLMGEAGPEAVMPLKRGKDGKLGVAAEGKDKEEGSTNITMNINAVDAQSFVQMLKTNKATVQALVVDSLYKNGQVRKAIQGALS